MSRPQFSMLGILVVACGVACWCIQHATQMQLCQQSEAWRQQAELQELCAAESKALSNLLARGQSRQFLSNAQIRELLRLRNQASQLHRTTLEANELRLANQRLLGALATSNTNEIGETPEPLAFTGFADPESALKSTLWAWLNGDRAAFLASFAPEERAGLEKDWQQKTETEIAAECRSYTPLYSSAAEGVCVLGKKDISSDAVAIDLYFEGDGKTRRFVLKRFADEWKVTGLQMILN